MVIFQAIRISLCTYEKDLKLLYNSSDQRHKHAATTHASDATHAQKEILVIFIWTNNTKKKLYLPSTTILNRGIVGEETCNIIVSKKTSTKWTTKPVIPTLINMGTFLRPQLIRKQNTKVKSCSYLDGELNGGRVCNKYIYTITPR